MPRSESKKKDTERHECSTGGSYHASLNMGCRHSYIFQACLKDVFPYVRQGRSLE